MPRDRKSVVPILHQCFGVGGGSLSPAESETRTVDHRERRGPALVAALRTAVAS